MLSTTVRRFRKQRKLTQQELAVAAGLTVGYIGQLEIGMHEDPKLSTLRKLAKALGVPVKELLE